MDLGFVIVLLSGFPVRKPFSFQTSAFLLPVCLQNRLGLVGSLGAVGGSLERSWLARRGAESRWPERNGARAHLLQGRPEPPAGATNLLHLVSFCSSEAV